MPIDGATFIAPVLKWLDRLIREYGLFGFMAFGYAAPFLIAWVLSGGLRRKHRVQPPARHTWIVWINRPPPTPPEPPPTIGWDREPCERHDDGDLF